MQFTSHELFPCKWQFPHPDYSGENGLLASGADFSPETLLHAYSNGLFPWTSNPITWWSPNPRTIFEIDQFHVPRRLERLMKQNRFLVTINTAFQRVMEECAKPGPGRESTWISKDFIKAYTRLHHLGHAHSVECWIEEGPGGKKTLAGGIYGVAIGGFFAGESMFHSVSNGSRIALTAFFRRLQERGFSLFDSQVISPATQSLGAIEIPRNEYLKRLAKAILLPCRFFP